MERSIWSGSRRVNNNSDHSDDSDDSNNNNNMPRKYEMMLQNLDYLRQ